ncbi:uncharacterized protein [Myotis yumanensis]|uniref:uncharacterized protein n=1 Tax=Myotis yumanensis TaxID=159337 RepID=UPI0038D0EDF9
MNVQSFWRDYKVLIVMVPLVGLIHLGWHKIKSSPIFQVPNKDNVPVPDSLALAGPPKDHVQKK